MIIQEKPIFFGLTDRKLFAILMTMFTLGTLTALALIIGAFIAVIYLLNLLINAVSELATNLVNLYAHADSLGKILLLLIVAYGSVKLYPPIRSSVRKAFQKSFCQ